MKIIVTHTNDLEGVEVFVNRLYRRIPFLWRRIFPAWFAMVLGPDTTFRTIASLHPLLKVIEYDARIVSERASYPDDWSAVYVILDHPRQNRLCWNLWVRHCEDREYLSYAVLSTIGAILWQANEHLRALWKIKLRGKYIDGERITDINADTVFCQSFAERVSRGHSYFYRKTPVSEAVLTIEKKIMVGSLSTVVDREWFDLGDVSFPTE